MVCLVGLITEQNKILIKSDCLCDISNHQLSFLCQKSQKNIGAFVAKIMAVPNR